MLCSGCAFNQFVSRCGAIRRDRSVGRNCYIRLRPSSTIKLLTIRQQIMRTPLQQPVAVHHRGIGRGRVGDAVRERAGAARRAVILVVEVEDEGGVKPASGICVDRCRRQQPTTERREQRYNGHSLYHQSEDAGCGGACRLNTRQAAHQIEVVRHSHSAILPA